MTSDKLVQLGGLVKQRRQERGLMAKDLAQRIDVTPSTITRIEQGALYSPRPHILAKIANELDLPVSDLFALADYLAPTQLPAFTPYLRTKYRDMPDEAKEELEASFSKIAKKYGYLADGPAPGEDET